MLRGSSRVCLKPHEGGSQEIHRLRDHCLSTPMSRWPSTTTIAVNTLDALIVTYASSDTNSVSSIVPVPSIVPVSSVVPVSSIVLLVDQPRVRGYRIRQLDIITGTSYLLLFSSKVFVLRQHRLRWFPSTPTPLVRRTRRERYPSSSNGDRAGCDDVLLCYCSIVGFRHKAGSGPIRGSPRAFLVIGLA